MKLSSRCSCLFAFFALLVVVATNGDNEVDELRKEVDELIDDMRSNIRGALANLETTDELQAKAETLQEWADIFRKDSADLEDLVKDQDRALSVFPELPPKLKLFTQWLRDKRRFVIGTVLAAAAVVPVRFLLFQAWRVATATADVLTLLRRMSRRKPNP